MKYIISESRLYGIMTKFLDDYLSKYVVVDNGSWTNWGSGEDNQIVYDNENEILFVRESLYELIKGVFSIDHHEYVEFIKSYMANKGYYVKRIV
jgi:hypothetical protein